jgi:hypothetical protein
MWHPSYRHAPFGRFMLWLQKIRRRHLIPYGALHGTAPLLDGYQRSEAAASTSHPAFPVLCCNAQRGQATMNQVNKQSGKNWFVSSQWSMSVSPPRSPTEPHHPMCSSLVRGILPTPCSMPAALWTPSQCRHPKQDHHLHLGCTSRLGKDTWYSHQKAPAKPQLLPHTGSLFH